MRLRPRRLAKANPSFILLLLLVIAIAARVSAMPADHTTTDPTDAQTTDDPGTTDSAPSVTETAAVTTDTNTSSTSESDTTSTTSSSSTSETMATTTDSDTTTTADSSTTTSDSSTTSTSSSTTSSTHPVVTVPPIANAPYMQTTNTPEGTVFIAVGAVLGLIGLSVLAWRAIIAWSVNRSVRRAAMIHSSESKRLLRGSKKKRSTVYAAAPTASVSLDKLGAATRANYKPHRVPSSNSGLFFSPTAGGAGSPASLNNAAGNRGSSYLPAGYYAAAGSSTPAGAAAHSTPYSPTAGLASPGYPPSSPTLPPIGPLHDPPLNPRQSYGGGSTSSLNLSQAPQGRAPSAYLEDLFESHAPPNHPNSGLR
ncbi:hypothetical protein NUU61_006964 [Penicillium alfredii]|uniref:Mid2 domain-containing protein n=1 Tax=Penicillium alfredii TaxID=1506179 RepID=A0A9W9F1Y9_9EURO|nr:uncharacterized protein NUU61_006964 [Penicillium alfredii]KAJ5092094.1 hypothetical protein NUU61_006964 [Penicillium alfredii]